MTTPGGTEICTMRIAVKLAGRDKQPGYFELKAFGRQAKACGEYLAKGREIAVDARLSFEEFETKNGHYASRVFLVADQVEFLASRRREAGDNGQPDPERADQPAPDSEEAPA